MHISFANPRVSQPGRDSRGRGRRRSGRSTRSSRTSPRNPRRSVRRSSTGMLVKRFFAERVLADQAWIHDDSLTRRQGARRARRRGARVRPVRARGVSGTPEAGGPSGPPAAAAAAPAFRRILIKLSGEAFAGSLEFGVDPDRVEAIARSLVGDPLARASRSRSSSAPGTSSGARPRRRRGWTARPPTTRACSRRC